MFNKSYRLVALIFAATLLVGCLVSGCGQKEETTPTDTSMAKKKQDR